MALGSPAWLFPAASPASLGTGRRVPSGGGLMNESSKSHRRGTKPALRPAPVELPEPAGAEPDWSELPNLDWSNDALPNSVVVFNFAVRQLMILASACPDFGVRSHAAEFLAREFSPYRAQAVS